MLYRSRRRGMGDAACAVNDAACLADLAAHPLFAVSNDPTVPPCSSITVASDFVGPVNCAGSQADINRAVTSGQISSIWGAIGDLFSPQPVVTPQWIAGIPNALVAVGGAILAVVLVASMGGGRR